MHIDMHVVSVKFSFQFANTIVSRIGTTHTKDTFRSFHLQTSGLVCSNFVLKQINNRIILLKSPKRILQYFYELPL